jgi:hypothetical protein
MGPHQVFCNYCARLVALFRDAAITHMTIDLNLRKGPIRRGQFNRAYVLGMAGATIASLGLFALSRGGGEIRDEGRAKHQATSDCVSGQRPIAATFRSDIEVIAFSLPPIQFGNRE